MDLIDFLVAAWLEFYGVKAGEIEPEDTTTDTVAFEQWLAQNVVSDDVATELLEVCDGDEPAGGGLMTGPDFEWSFTVWSDDDPSFSSYFAFEFGPDGQRGYCFDSIPDFVK